MIYTGMAPEDVGIFYCIVAHVQLPGHGLMAIINYYSYEQS
jgi:hypothetical protein